MKLLLTTLALLTPSIGFSAPPARTDDSDLAGSGARVRREAPSARLSPDRIEIHPGAPLQASLRVVIRRADNSTETAVGGLAFRITSAAAPGASLGRVQDATGTLRIENCAEGSRFRAESILQKDRYSISQNGRNYGISGELNCGEETTWILNADSDAGQALGIWRIAQMAEQKLAVTVGLGFWSRRIGFVWPADGDYYSWGSVNLTRGDHWDVVGHELGHAIYDQAGIGAFGGGQHKIDECYSGALALSEGWASMFSAWVSLSLDDPDAKFEFMVPRRAPIQLENVPSDVCNGPTNEWRVSSFFWDLIDLHDDGEKVEDPFQALWNKLAGRKARDATDAARIMEQAGFDRGKLDLAWELNFRRPRN